LRAGIKNRSPNLLYPPHYRQRYTLSYVVKRKDFFKKIYGVSSWTDAEDFLNQVAIKKGKLKKGGEPDVDATAKLILFDWQRGDIPFYNLPEGEVDKF
jgi:ribosome biogenesis GTPase A